MATKKERMLFCRGANSETLRCIGTKKESDFYDSWSMWDNGKTTYCKDCLNKIYETYLKQLGSEKLAMYYTCLQINMPFVKEIFETIDKKYDKSGKKMSVTINRYITEFQKKTNKKTMWQDFSSTDVLLSSDEKDIKVVDNDKRAKFEDTWGFQEEDFDYDFLENTFIRYTDGIDFSNQQQIDLYRDLCRDRLLLRKINDGRYNGEETIDKVQNRISKTMSILKVDRFEEKKNKSDIEKILEYQIWEIENTEPAEVVDKKEYEDFLDIQKSWGKNILRCVKNILSNSKEYPNITKDSDKY